MQHSEGMHQQLHLPGIGHRLPSHDAMRAHAVRSADGLQMTVKVRPNPGTSKNSRFTAQSLSLEELLHYTEDDTKESVFEVRTSHGVPSGRQALERLVGICQRSRQVPWQCCERRAGPLHRWRCLRSSLRRCWRHAAAAACCAACTSSRSRLFDSTSRK